MKKNLFLLIAAMLAMPAMFAQTKNVARECVLFELMTGVHCGNCPAADEAIEEMLADGLLIAPVCYQAPSYSVPELTNDEVAARVSYYSAMGYPTLFMDGSISLPGGSPGMNYMYYQPYYEQEIAKTSPFTIAMDLESVGGVLYKVNCHVEQVGDCTGSDVRVFIVLTQSQIPFSWGGGDYVNWNVRDMIPTEQGTPFVGSSMDFSETFEIPYPLKDCQIIAWVQDYAGSKEVYQAVMMDASTVSVADNSMVSEAVYPNPSNGQFNLNLGEGQWDVEAYDITGRKVYENHQEGHSAIDLGQCPKGMYFLNAKNESEEITTKMMVK